MIEELRAENPAYDKGISFFTVDWDVYSEAKISTDLQVPRPFGAGGTEGRHRDRPGDRRHVRGRHQGADGRGAGCRDDLEHLSENAQAGLLATACRAIFAAVLLPWHLGMSASMFTGSSLSMGPPFGGFGLTLGGLQLLAAGGGGLAPDPALVTTGATALVLGMSLAKSEPCPEKL